MEDDRRHGDRRRRDDAHKVTVETAETRVEIPADGPVMPRELNEHLGRVYDRINDVKDGVDKIRTAIIVLAILAGPKFIASAVDVVTGAAQAFGGHGR